MAIKRNGGRATTTYSGEHLNQVAFPMGGMGAGMVCLEGTGAFSHVSLRHQPNVFNEPMMFAALHVKGAPTARLLEGPVPMRKAFGAPGSGNGGGGGQHHGLPRFAQAEFTPRFPFARVALKDPSMPVAAEVTGWSPFVPGDADSASLPVAGLEYRLLNRTSKPVKGVLSFHALNLMRANQVTAGTIEAKPDGFVLGVPGTACSPFVASWRLSRLIASSASIAEAPCVKLSDDLEWQPAAMTGFFADAYQRHGAVDGYAYLGTRVRVARAGTWIFSIGHDGGMRLFVDGKAVHTRADRENPLRPGRTEVSVALDAGDHEIMFASELRGFGWGVSLSFAMPPDRTGDGEPEYPTPEKWGGASSSTGGAFTAFTTAPGVTTDCAWFRGGWFDPLTMLWQNVMSGKAVQRPPHAEGKPGDGASLYVPFALKPRAETTVRIQLAWYVPESGMTIGEKDCDGACACGGSGPSSYVPWYATRFSGIAGVAAYWREHYDALRARSLEFSDCFYDTTLPVEAVEAIAANLTILKSPTVLRQHDGRLWGWEGCCDTAGCCNGTCTHVWNYAQSMPHLFADLERGLRETEFFVSQDERGHQAFRTRLPISPTKHNFHAAADGQLGGIMKVHREWRISGDTAWLRKMWPRVKQSLDYCIATWDPDHTGTLVEPHHNTYDIEFWGADGMCTSFYLGALQAAVRMGAACGEEVPLYRELLASGLKAMGTRLWNGHYFYQRVQWEGLRAGDPTEMKSAVGVYSPEARAILQQEGPKYQYGTGCLADGVLGDWLSRVCGVGGVLDASKVNKHISAVFEHNFKPSLADHANPQRPGFAFGSEGGLILCTWPKGRKPALPFPYSDEVWTGIEYQVAAHLIMMGRLGEGLSIVKAVRDRYDGRSRNPFNEYECGHWYARAMSSYSLLQALSGARYDAVEKTLYLKPAVKGNFRAFISTATGFGTVGVKRGKPYLKVVSGRIDVARIELQ
ncbi:MAG: GH116 family glycosyl hydrolase [Kiritimatiellae bacterium]|nr:GH116 family glycosyl hydrolase [Kiritimatiellia bacterium]